MYEVELLRECYGTVSTALSLEDSQQSNVLEWLIDTIRVFAIERFFIFHSYGDIYSDSGEQLNSCCSFLSLEWEMENWLSSATKIEPKLMMDVSLVLFFK